MTTHQSVELRCIACGSPPWTCLCPCPICGGEQDGKQGCRCAYEELALELRAAKRSISDISSELDGLRAEEQRLRKELRRLASILQQPEANNVLDVLYPDDCVITFADEPK
jgi:hypothetical protein